MPLVLDVFDNAGRVAVPPAWVDRELPGNPGPGQLPFVGQAGFLEELAPGRVGVSLTRPEGYPSQTARSQRAVSAAG